MRIAPRQLMRQLSSCMQAFKRSEWIRGSAKRERRTGARDLHRRWTATRVGSSGVTEAIVRLPAPQRGSEGRSKGGPVRVPSSPIYTTYHSHRAARTDAGSSKGEARRT
jgi:hypothetical protein